jgi:hypothetical protein
MAKTSPSIQANDFTVSDEQTTISFATTSFTGKPTFSYKNGPKHLQFTGDEIRTADTEFSKLATVTIGGEGDAGVSTVTLFVPTVTVPSTAEPVDIDTIAILTEQRRLGPAHQRYEALYLHGTARQTTF